MALGDPSVTAAQLKTYLGITDTVDDTAITNALAAVSSSINKHCNRQFNDAGTTSARVYQPHDLYTCYVDDFSTTTGLAIRTDEDDDGVYETVWSSLTDYELFPLNGIVDGELGWPYRKIRGLGGRWFPMTRYPIFRYRSASVQVTARWGWAAVPAGVYQACLVLASDIFGLKDARFGVQAYGDFVVRVKDNPRAVDLLRPYRLKPVLVG